VLGRSPLLLASAQHVQARKPSQRGLIRCHHITRPVVSVVSGIEQHGANSRLIMAFVKTQRILPSAGGDKILSLFDCIHVEFLILGRLATRSTRAFAEETLQE
jgi:hypothetical protein